MALQNVIQKCLEKDRAVRYQKAAEIRSDLEKIKRRSEHPVLSRWKPLATVAVVLVALLAGILYWRSRKAAVFTNKDTIVLADFVNTTGDAVFDDALKQALAIQLEQSPFLTVVSDRKVIETLKLMNRPANERLTKAVAEEVCLRDNSKVVAGRLDRRHRRALPDYPEGHELSDRRHDRGRRGRGREPEPGAESAGGSGQSDAQETG